MNTKSGYKLKLDQPRSLHVRAVLAQLPTDQCVEWPGRKDRQGYGSIASKVTTIAHRFVWIHFYGVPLLPELDHLCRNRGCVNPAHLEPVTAAENSRRRSAAMATCRNGHPYGVDEYLYGGRRYCRACRRINDRKRPSRGACNKQKVGPA